MPLAASLIDIAFVVVFTSWTPRSVRWRHGMESRKPLGDHNIQMELARLIFKLEVQK
jgi:hypothetical protein